MTKMKQALLLAFVAVIGMTSCKKDSNGTTANPVVTDSATLTVSADAAAGSYTYFNLRNKTIVAAADVNTINWDLGMLFTNFRVNASPNGPGTGGVVVVDGTFSSVTTAPETGYSATITDYNQWALYNSTTRAFTPKPGRIFIIRTANNQYVKLEMLSADYGPLAGTPPRPTTIIYKFRYAIQTNGTRNF